MRSGKHILFSVNFSMTCSGGGGDNRIMIFQTGYCVLLYKIKELHQGSLGGLDLMSHCVNPVENLKLWGFGVTGCI